MESGRSHRDHRNAQARDRTPVREPSAPRGRAGAPRCARRRLGGRVERRGGGGDAAAHRRRGHAVRRTVLRAQRRKRRTHALRAGRASQDEEDRYGVEAHAPATPGDDDAHVAHRRRRHRPLHRAAEERLDPGARGRIVSEPLGGAPGWITISTRESTVRRRSEPSRSKNSAFPSLATWSARTRTGELGTKESSGFPVFTRIADGEPAQRQTEGQGGRRRGIEVQSNA